MMISDQSPVRRSTKAARPGREFLHFRDDATYQVAGIIDALNCDRRTLLRAFRDCGIRPVRWWRGMEWVTGRQIRHAIERLAAAAAADDGKEVGHDEH